MLISSQRNSKMKTSWDHHLKICLVPLPSLMRMLHLQILMSNGFESSGQVWDLQELLCSLGPKSPRSRERSAAIMEYVFSPPVLLFLWEGYFLYPVWYLGTGWMLLLLCGDVPTTHSCTVSDNSVLFLSLHVMLSCRCHPQTLPTTPMLMMYL